MVLAIDLQSFKSAVKQGLETSYLLLGSSGSLLEFLNVWPEVVGEVFDALLGCKRHSLSYFFDG